MEQAKEMRESYKEREQEQNESNNRYDRIEDNMNYFNERE